MHKTLGNLAKNILYDIFPPLYNTREKYDNIHCKNIRIRHLYRHFREISKLAFAVSTVYVLLGKQRLRFMCTNTFLISTSRSKYLNKNKIKDKRSYLTPLQKKCWERETSMDKYIIVRL